MAKRLTSLGLFGYLKWIDGRPLLDTIEAYRRQIFTDVLDSVDEKGRVRFNLALMGRGKKNFKSCDAVLASIFGLIGPDSPGGHQCYLVANDEDQAGDDLELAKLLIRRNPLLETALIIQNKEIKRKD